MKLLPAYWKYIQDNFETPTTLEEPLWTAVVADDVLEVKRLLSVGANIYTPASVFQMTPIHLAGLLGHDEILRLLISSSTPELMHKAAPLDISVKGMSLRSKMNMRYPAVNATDEHGNTPLHYAVAKNRALSALILIYYGADIEARNTQSVLSVADRQSVLMLADSLQMIQILLDSGVDTDSEDNPIWSRSENRVNIVELLLQNHRRPHVGWYGTTLVHDAAWSGVEGFEMICLLNKWGFDLSPRDYFGKTPLHLAIWNKDNQIVEYLLQNGADLGEWTGVETPLEYAVQKRRYTMIAMIEAESVRRINTMKKEALAMSQHKRLGNMSKLYDFDPFLLQMITDYVDE
jgi:ankyrin repeat protein